MSRPARFSHYHTPTKLEAKRAAASLLDLATLAAHRVDKDKLRSLLREVKAAGGLETPTGYQAYLVAFYGNTQRRTER